MIYWYAAIVIGTFLLGFMLGMDRGIRSSHRMNTDKQTRRTKSVLKRHKAYNNENVHDPMWSNKRVLRLVKKDDYTRE